MVEEWTHESDPERVAEVGSLALDRERVRRPDGVAADHASMTAAGDVVPEAVAIIALTPERDVVLVEQYRPTFESICLECPAGGVDAGESHLEAATRELREETGYAPEDVELLQTYRPLGVARAERAIVVATDVEPLASGPDPDPDEFLDVHVVDAERAMRIVDDPEATDMELTGWTLTPLLLAEHAGYL